MLHRSVVIMDNFLEKNSIMKRFVLLSFLLVYFGKFVGIDYVLVNFHFYFSLLNLCVSAIHDSVFAKSDPVNHDYSYNDTSENFSVSPMTSCFLTHTVLDCDEGKTLFSLVS